MSIATADPVSIALNGLHLEDVSRFTYLGSTISSDGDSTADVQVRIGKAAGMFRRLNSVWKRNLVSIETKIKLYMSIVNPTAIYASETWK